MVKKAVPICACPSCFKALEIMAQETFQTRGDWGQPSIKYYKLKCKDCICDLDDEDEPTFEDRIFQVRVEMTQISPSRTYFRIENRLPKISKARGRPRKWPNKMKEKPNVVR